MPNLKNFLIFEHLIGLKMSLYPGNSLKVTQNSLTKKLITLIPQQDNKFILQRTLKSLSHHHLLINAFHPTH